MEKKSSNFWLLRYQFAKQMTVKTKRDERTQKFFLFIQYFETKEEIHFYLFKRAKIKGTST